MEYVCSGATLKCTMGTSCSHLKATPKNVILMGQDQANIADYVSMKNIPGFGRCRSLGYPPTASATAANHGRLTPMPCVPGTCPKWSAVDPNSLICGEPALLKPATLKCVYGGRISIVNPGQTLEIKARPVSSQAIDEQQEKLNQEIPEELLQEFKELDTEGLNIDSVLDGVQFALDAAGMVPVLGAIPDLINASISILRGDLVGAGLSIVAAVPGVGDVVGGAKIAYKGTKVTQNAASKSLKIRKAVTKTPSNKLSVDSVRSAKSTVISSKIKSENVIHQNFDDLSKLRAKNASIERQIKGKKVANSKYNDKFDYDTSIKNSTTNSTDNVGSFSSSSTGTYRANLGNVVQETTNTPRSGSATSKQSDSGNYRADEPVNLNERKQHKQQEQGRDPIDKNPNNIEMQIQKEAKTLEQTKEAMRNAENVTNKWEFEA